MEKDAYKSWINLFNNEVFDSFKNEQTELRKTVMLITALRIEIKNVQQGFDNELINLRKQLNKKKLLEKEIKSVTKTKNILIIDNDITQLEPQSDLDSPDIFHNSIHLSSNNTSIVEDDITSPTLLSKRQAKVKIHESKKINKLKKNIFKTPKLNIKKSKKCEKENCNETKLEEILPTNDTTFFKETNSELGITKLLDYINEEDENQMDSTDEFSKAILFDDESPVQSSPKKKFKSFVEPVVRGNARKVLLKGFSCAQCRDFYASMNLSEEELKKKMDECSKHRFKYQPPDDTYPGIWDLTIPEVN